MDAKARQILQYRKEGLYCPPGGFYVDPMRKVKQAVVTHAHADHAIRGHQAVLATAPTLDAMKVRYGPRFCARQQATPYGHPIKLGEVTITLIPAGHILGSAQVVIDWNGYRAICAGDYKRADDPTAQPFEVQPAHLFVTEATFGVPVYRHNNAVDEVKRLLDVWRTLDDAPLVIAAYSLGKAQHMQARLRAAGINQPIHVAKPVLGLNEVYERHGVSLGEAHLLNLDQDLSGEIILAPPGMVADHLPDALVSFASGWNRVTKRRQKGRQVLPLTLSDHADWPALTQTIAEVAPDHLAIAYGDTKPLQHWASARGINAFDVKSLAP
ncbi:MAG: ligase-associated DNA damage response exonuclease [Alphaproteobacteria bacterium]